MKYVKAGDDAPDAKGLADIKAKAIEQLNRYSSDSTLNSTLSTLNYLGSSVALHRLVLVFHGGDCVLAEEV